MKVAPALLVLLASAGSAHALIGTLGEKGCADAGFVATVGNQSYEPVPDVPKGWISMDVLLQVTFNVKKVMFGPISRGPLPVSFVRHEELPDVIKQWRIFARRKGAGWTLSECKPKA